MDYFLKLTEYNEDMTKQFVATLQYDEAVVKGLKVDVLESTIVEVSSFPWKGEEFPIRENVVASRDEFREHGENLDLSSQGTKRLSLPRVWAFVASYIIILHVMVGSPYYMQFISNS